MGLLDKLKPQPRWKHVDAAIRLDAVREVDDPAELALLAESDPDAKVRRAAIGTLADTACLGRIASADADEATRDRAAVSTAESCQDYREEIRPPEGQMRARSRPDPSR